MDIFVLHSSIFKVTFIMGKKKGNRSKVRREEGSSRVRRRKKVK